MKIKTTCLMECRISMVFGEVVLFHNVVFELITDCILKLLWKAKENKDERKGLL
jgi:hypothetical protein